MTQEKRVLKNPGKQIMQHPVNVTGPDCVRFAIIQGNLPSVRYTLRLGELLRKALMSLSRTQTDSQNVSQVFSGKTFQGKPLNTHHTHAFFIPEDVDNDGRIDHFLVYSRMGFDARALHAIEALRRLWDGKRFDLRLKLEIVEFASIMKASTTSPLLAQSLHWISKTPYFLTRYPKRYRDGRKKINSAGLWIDGPVFQIRRDLAFLGISGPKRITTLNFLTVQGRKRTARWFVSRRAANVRRPDIDGIFAELCFSEPVCGPLAIGYGSHYGLGLFEPD